MKTAIVFISKHGSTAKVAKMLSENFHEDDVQLFDLKENRLPEIDDFDNVLIGGSIHAGMIQKRVRTFCTSRFNELMSKDIGLFICCMEKGEKAEEQFRNAYHNELLNHAKAKGILGGEFLFEKMNFLEKAIVKKVSGVKETTSQINQEAILEFLKEFN